MKKILAIAVAAALGQAVPAQAQVSQAEWEAFKAEFAAMAGRVDALEKENARLRAHGTVPVEDLGVTSDQVRSLVDARKATSWAETLKWSGDFRYRYESIEEDGKKDRDRNRIRARAALDAKPSDDLKIGLGLASAGDDPVSTNQTLGGGGTTKDIRLDLAYFTWSGIDNTYLTAGKFKNPFYRVQKSGLIWDGDFRPEGISAGWDNGHLFANAIYSFIESDSNKNDDAFWGVQVGGQFSPTDSVQLLASAKYLDIPVKGREAIFDGGFFGNSSEVVNGVEVYANDYKLINASLELAFALADMPVSVYADWVENDDVSDLETGYIVGAKLGSAKKRGSWQLQYQYQVLEADAVLGLVSDSDFAGGGTDGEGHKLAAKYAINDKWYIGATYFDTKRGVDLGSDADYQRLQIDTGFKY